LTITTNGLAALVVGLRKVNSLAKNFTMAAPAQILLYVLATDTHRPTPFATGNQLTATKFVDHMGTLIFTYT
jgi:hypothetical protein